jgi:signal peptidase I
MRNFFKESGGFIWETAKVVALSLLIILPIRYFIMQPFFVRGESMNPSFNDKDYLIVDEISYRLGEPKRGDVIVFRFPQDPSQFYIKRIIGMPEETIEIKDGNVVVYNRETPAGMTLTEPYLSEVTPGDVKIKLDEREYFVLGDNRDASSDSRRWGPLYRHLIVGKALLRVWPLDSAHAIDTPLYLIDHQTE